MRGGERVEDVLAGTSARINETGGLQMVERRSVDGETFALIVGAESAAAIGSFVPPKTKPTQILCHRLNELRPTAGAIQVVVAQHQNSFSRAAAFLSGPEGPGMA